LLREREGLFDFGGEEEKVVESGATRAEATLKAIEASSRFNNGDKSRENEAFKKFDNDRGEGNGAVVIGGGGVAFTFVDRADEGTFPADWDNAVEPGEVDDVGEKRDGATGEVAEEVRGDVVRANSDVGFATSDSIFDIVEGERRISRIRIKMNVAVVDRIMDEI